MQFLYPSFLWALLAISIPIIIHLFHFRRFKKIPFTNVKFMKEIKEETSARRKVKHLLVLLARILAIAFIVFAFAKPFLPAKNIAAFDKRVVSIYIDNSFSMNALSEDVFLLDRAKKTATDIVKSYTPEVRFQILTNNLEGKHQRLVSKEEAFGYIDEIKSSPKVQLLDKIQERQKNLLINQTDTEKEIYWITDFQKSITDINSFEEGFNFNLVPIRAVEEKNLSIDSVWLNEPILIKGRSATLLIAVANHSDQKAENVQLSFKSKGQTKPVGLISIEPRSTQVDSFVIPINESGWFEGEFTISDYPIQFDDNMFITFEVAEKVNVLSLNDGNTNKFLKSAYAGIENIGFETSSITNINYSNLQNYDLIILNELKQVTSGLSIELKKFLENGGNVMVFPDELADINSYNSFMNRVGGSQFSSFQKEEISVESIEKNEFIFQDVFKSFNKRIILPKVKGYFPLNKQTAGQNIMGLRNGDAFVKKHLIGKGQLYICSAPLNREYSDLVNNGAIFIPLLFKSSIAKTHSPKLNYFIGDNKPIIINQINKQFEKGYRLKAGTLEVIPQQQIINSNLVLNTSNSITQPNIYRLLDTKNVIYQLAYNYNRKESNLSLTDLGVLSGWAEEKNVNLMGQSVQKDISYHIGQQTKGTMLWQICIILALIFLFVELLLLRFWKT